MTERILSQVVELDLPRCQNVYGVAPCTAAGAAGTECYNTFATCQDKENYTPGVQTVRFVGLGSPIDPTAPGRPYISRLSRAVTELNPEEGLARRSASTVSMVDETCSDVEFDPYIATRPAKASGTFWTRLLARTKNYPGRFARIKQAYMDHGVFGAYSTELYVIDKIAGPTSGGDITITLKDVTSLADQSQTPTPTSGKLSLDLQVSDLVINLSAGDGTQYNDPTVTGNPEFVRIGDEIIRYGSIVGDTLVLPTSSYRAQFGTTGQSSSQSSTDTTSASAGDGVQQCRVWIDEPWSNVVMDILNDAGIDDTYIDVAGIQSEDATWLGVDYRVTRCVSDPQGCSELMSDLLSAAQAMLWWDPEAQLIKVKVFAPQSPSQVVSFQYDENKNLLDKSVSIERKDDLRITLTAAYYGLRTAVVNVDESKNYKFGEVAVDIDAESANEYDARIVQTFYAPWYNDANEQGMRTHVRRYLARHRDAPQDLSFDLDPKDKAVQIGSVADVQSQLLVNADGTTKTVRVLVTRKDDQGTSIKCKGRVTTFDRRYGFIAPALTSNYPANNGYACVSSALGKMSDGSDGYLVI